MENKLKIAGVLLSTVVTFLTLYLSIVNLLEVFTENHSVKIVKRQTVQEYDFGAFDLCLNLKEFDCDDEAEKNVALIAECHQAKQMCGSEDVVNIVPIENTKEGQTILSEMENKRYAYIAGFLTLIIVALTGVTLTVYCLYFYLN